MQMKSAAKTNPISNRSVELWKTINNWITAPPWPPHSRDTFYYFALPITTPLSCPTSTRSCSRNSHIDNTNRSAS